MQHIGHKLSTSRFRKAVHSKEPQRQNASLEHIETGNVSIVKALLTSLSGVGTQVIDQSQTWKKLRKTVEALSLINISAQRSPVLSLYEMAKEKLPSLRPNPISVRCFTSGTADHSSLEVFGFSNFDTLVLYIMSKSPKDEDFFVDLNSLLVGYNQGQSRKMIEYARKEEKNYIITEVPLSGILSDNILAFDLRPQELLEVTLHYPEFLKDNCAYFHSASGKNVKENSNSSGTSIRSR